MSLMDELNKERLLQALLHPVTLRAGGINVLIVAAVVVTVKLAPSYLVAFLLVAGAYAAYYYLDVCAPTQLLFVPESGTAQRLLDRMPCLRLGGYRPSPWLANRHIQTLWGAFRPQDASRLGISREFAHGVFADGENLVLDWYRATPEQCARGEDEWRDGLVAAFAGVHDFIEHTVEQAAQQRRRHHFTAASEGKIPRNNPVIIVFHGLTSACGDPNILRLIELFNAQGWHAVIPIRRGCGDDPELVTRPKYYAYGGLEDAGVTVEHIARTVPDHPLFAIGISAGSNVAVNYLGTQGRCSLVLGAVSVANGFCWQRGTQALVERSPVWDVVMTALVKASMYTPHAQIVSTTHTFEKDGAIVPQADDSSSSSSSKHNGTNKAFESSANNGSSNDVSSPAVAARGSGGSPKQRSIKKAASMREIDDLVSKNLHGFDSLDEFYAEQSCVHRLHRVKVPTVFINAIDDPIANFGTVPLPSLLANNDNFLIALTPRGGHLGWGTGMFPFGGYRATHSYMDTFSVEALRAVMAEAKHRLRTTGSFFGVCSADAASAGCATAAGASSGTGGVQATAKAAQLERSRQHPRRAVGFQAQPMLVSQQQSALLAQPQMGSPSNSGATNLSAPGAVAIVSTPTMVVPREAALFPAATKKSAMKSAASTE